MNCYSDLNIEMALLPSLAKRLLKTHDERELEISESEITSDTQAIKLNRRKGYYITICDDKPSNLTSKNANISQLLSKYLGKAFAQNRIKDGKILVAGLGNSGLTADALGHRVLQRLKVGVAGDFEVCTLAPMVGAVTGVESFDVIKGVCNQIKPSAVIAIDALATQSPKRLCSCYQLTDAGIKPGSGVGNGKKTLCKEHLDCDVIAIGVPFVAKASAIVQFYTENPLNYQNINPPLEQLVLTPKDIDDCVNSAADIVADALNKFFFDDFTQQ